MAYLGHSPVRDFHHFKVATAATHYGPTFLKSALVAIAAAAAILALSEVGGSAAGTVASAKADRLAAPVAANASGAGYMVDAAARTTTVERGAATPLSPDSPFRGDR